MDGSPTIYIKKKNENNTAYYSQFLEDLSPGLNVIILYKSSPVSATNKTYYAIPQSSGGGAVN